MTDMGKGFLLVAAVAAAICLPAGSLSAGELSRVRRMALLDEANQAFQRALDATDQREAEANCRKAVDAFKALADDGVRNGKLYYNLANAYFRLNDLSSAILNYRRALRLMPGNTRITENLRFARSSVHDKIDVSGKRALIRSLFFWHFSTSLKSRTIAAIFCYLLVWGLLAAAIFLKWRPLRPGIAAAIVLTVALGISCAVDNYTRRHHLEGVITAEQVILRKANGMSSEPKYSAPLHSGSEFSIIEQRGKWWHIGLSDGKTGWIPAGAGEII